MGTTNVIDVAAGLIFRDERLLLAQRHSHAHLGDLWEFPGGKREGNETFEEALVRELEEELGVLVEVKSMVFEITHSYPEKTVSLKFFKCSLIRGEPKAIDCQDLAWVGSKELSKYSFPEADAGLIELLESDFDLWG